MRPHTPATLPPPAPARRRRPRGGPLARLRRLSLPAVLSRSRALLAAVGLVAGLVLFSAGAAFAYFLATASSNSAQAVAATLATPSGGAQNGTAKPASIPLTWTAPSGYTPTGYAVLRCAGSCSGSGSFTTITTGTCGTAAIGASTATTCTDNDAALAPGTSYTYEVEALLGSWVSGPSATFTAATTGASQLAFTTQPTSGQKITSGVAFPVTVTIQDANGNTVTGDSTDQVTLAVKTGASGATLSCTGGLTATASSGVASFTGCNIYKAATNYQLKATSGSLAQATSNTFEITAAAPAKLAFTTPLTSVQAKGTGSFPVAVTIQDASGNTVAGDSTDNVTLTIASNTGTSGAALSCTDSGGLTVQASSGVASFTGCAIDKVGTNYKLTATSGSLTPATSNSFSITAGSAATITATGGGNQAANVNSAFSSPLAATVKDIDGNPVSGASVTFTAPSSGASATFASSGCTSNSPANTCTATTDANGKATSSTFTANSTAGGYSVSATTTGVSSPATFAETNNGTPSVSISSLATANVTGGTAGKPDPGDTVTIGFSGALTPSSVCSGWTGGTVSSSGTITVSNVSGNNVLTFAPSSGTCNLGTINLGSGGYFNVNGGSTTSLTSSSLAYSSTSHTLTLTLGTGTNGNGNGSAGTVPGGSVLTLNMTSNGVLDSNGIPLTGYTLTGSSGIQF